MRSCIQAFSRRSNAVQQGQCCLMMVIVSGCSDQKKQACALLEKAVIRQQEESHEDAIRLLDRAIALDKDLGEALYARGVSEMRLRNYDDALLHIRRARKTKHD